MARSSGIQWTSNLQSQLRREVKNYNARVRAFAKKHPSFSVPPIVSYKESKRLITSKREYNKFIKDLQSATSKSLTPAKKTGVSPYERRLRKRAKSDVNRRVRLEEARQKKRLSVIQNILVDSSPGRFPTESRMLAMEIGLVEGDPENLEKLQRWLNENTAKSELWKQNYLKSIIKSMTDFSGGYTTDAIDALEKLYQKISTMDLEDFLIGQLVASEELALQYVYANKKVGGVDEYASRLERIISKWDEISG